MRRGIYSPTQGALYLGRKVTAPVRHASLLPVHNLLLPLQAWGRWGLPHTVPTTMSRKLWSNYPICMCCCFLPGPDQTGAATHVLQGALPCVGLSSPQDPGVVHTSKGWERLRSTVFLLIALLTQLQIQLSCLLCEN